MAATCPRCGTSNRPTAKFCMRCVTPLPAAPAEGEAGPQALEERTVACDRPDDFTRMDGLRPPPERSPFADHALPEGALIEGFRILRPIGEGGFGIVYLAWDCALERHVAIKEYMPSSLAVRTNSLFDVSARSERDRETFDAGLRSFVNEARLLARFDHPALVKVLRFWEGNRTAYMAMPFYEGPTLKTALAAMDGPPSEQQVREWLRPLLDALSVIHRENCYHRDISPDNILLTSGGPVLLDFGAARRVISDMTQALTAVLKPGFAPIEQYGGAMMQGPWTDLYALAGVVHYAITGRPPLASAVRIVKDTHRPLAVARAGQYRDEFLRAIDAGLGVRPEDRPQDVARFCELLDAEVGPGIPALSPVPAQRPSGDLVAEPAPSPLESPRAGGPAHAPTVVPDPGNEPRAADVPRRRRKTSHAAAVVALLAGSGAAWWLAARSTAGPEAASGSNPVAMVAPARPVEKPVLARAPVALPTVAQASALTAAPAPTAESAPTAAPALAAAPAPAASVEPAAAKVAPVPRPVALPPPSAAVARAPASASASARAPAPRAVASAPAPAPAPRAVASAPAPAPRAVASAPAPAPVASSAKAPKPDSAGAPAVRAPPPVALVAELASAGKEAPKPPRCGDLVLKSSLESLNREEFAYLKKECR